jgi:Phage major capsid protein E
MQQSSFIKYIQKFFTGIVLAVTTKLNDSKNPVVYYHKRFLKKDFSVDGKWESINAANTLVMADVVAMDSSLPLKKRDSISKANGDIPKMGMELKLNEKQLTDLDTLALRPGTEQQLIAKLFADTPKAIGGIYERNEAIFLEALSSGVCVVEDTETVGTGVRLDFGYLAANKFGVTTVWSNVASTPLNDLERAQTQAKSTGSIITKFLMDRTAFNNMVKTTQVKELWAFYIGFTGSATQVPSLTKVNQALQDNYGYTIEIIERSVRYERNGTQTIQTPWVDGAVVGITTEQLGSLVWATLAEVNHPVENVNYETADDYILVSKYRLNRPSLTEVTSSQARVVPVLTNTDQIFLIDSKTVQA